MKSIKNISVSIFLLSLFFVLSCQAQTNASFKSLTVDSIAPRVGALKMKQIEGWTINDTTLRNWVKKNGGGGSSLDSSKLETKYNFLNDTISKVITKTNANFTKIVKYSGDTVIYMPNQISFKGSTFNSSGGGKYLTHSSSIDGYYNTSLGKYSLQKITTGASNLALGYNTLYNLTTGTANQAAGFNSLSNLTTGSHNDCYGNWTGNSTTTGNGNSIFGHRSFIFNSTGSYNVILGYYSAYYGNYNNCVIIGANASSSGSSTKGLAQTGQIKIGYQAGYSDTVNNVLYIQNSSATTNIPIYGDMASYKYGINWNKANTMNFNLNVGGKAGMNAISDTASSTDLMLMPRRWILDRIKTPTVATFSTSGTRTLTKTTYVADTVGYCSLPSAGTYLVSYDMAISGNAASVATSTVIETGCFLISATASVFQQSYYDQSLFAFAAYTNTLCRPKASFVITVTSADKLKVYATYTTAPSAGTFTATQVTMSYIKLY